MILHLHIRGDDDLMAGLDEMSSGTIDTDHSAPSFAHDCVSSKALPIVDIVNLDSFKRQDV